MLGLTHALNIWCVYALGIITRNSKLQIYSHQNRITLNFSCNCHILNGQIMIIECNHWLRFRHTCILIIWDVCTCTHNTRPLKSGLGKYFNIGLIVAGCLDGLQVFLSYSSRHVKNRQNKLIWSLRWACIYESNSYHMVGNFREGFIFAFFVSQEPFAKIKTAKILSSTCKRMKSPTYLELSI